MGSGNGAHSPPGIVAGRTGDPGEKVIRDSFENRPGGVLTFRTIRFRQAPVNSVD